MSREVRDGPCYGCVGTGMLCCGVSAIRLASTECSRWWWGGWVSMSVLVSGVWQGPGPPPSRQAAGDQGPSVARDPPRGSKWDDTPVVVIFVVEVGLRLTLALTGYHPEGRLTQPEGSTPARKHAHPRTHTPARQSLWFSALAHKSPRRRGRGHLAELGSGMMRFPVAGEPRRHPSPRRALR